MPLLLPVLAVAALCALLAAPAAVAKDGVTARLERPLPLDAPAGKRITVVWSLASPGPDGERRPFGASGVFVRLRSAATGRRSTKAHGRELRLDRYKARVRVPRGGIGGIRFGLEGWRMIAGLTEDADVDFPLENDPFASVRVGVGLGGDAIG